MRILWCTKRISPRDHEIQKQGGLKINFWIDHENLVVYQENLLVRFSWYTTRYLMVKSEFYLHPPVFGSRGLMVRFSWYTTRYLVVNSGIICTFPRFRNRFLDWPWESSGVPRESHHETTRCKNRGVKINLEFTMRISWCTKRISPWESRGVPRESHHETTRCNNRGV